jgi:glucose/mannose-6-phosphate isomerase
MIQELLQWPDKLTQGAMLAEKLSVVHPLVLEAWDKVAFVGMGGSGIAGRIMKTFLDRHTSHQIILVDSPALPGAIDDKTLVFITSYSGNTWETLEAFKALLDRQSPMVVLAHHGALLAAAKKHDVPFVHVPESLQPRTALGLFLGFFVSLFAERGVAPLRESVYNWQLLARGMLPHYQATYFKEALAVLHGKEMFHVWGVADDSAMAAYRGATQFNENAKVQAVLSIFPELAHNLLVGVGGSTQKPSVVWYQTDFLSENMKKGVVALHDILYDAGVDLYKVPVFGDTFEGQVFSMILWTDFASYYLAQERGVDAQRVRIIEELKQRQQLSGIFVEV